MGPVELPGDRGRIGCQAALLRGGVKEKKSKHEQNSYTVWTPWVTRAAGFREGHHLAMYP